MLHALVGPISRPVLKHFPSVSAKLHVSTRHRELVLRPTWRSTTGGSRWPKIPSRPSIWSKGSRLLPPPRSLTVRSFLLGRLEREREREASKKKKKHQSRERKQREKHIETKLLSTGMCNVFLTISRLLFSFPLFVLFFSTEFFSRKANSGYFY